MGREGGKTPTKIGKICKRLRCGNDAEMCSISYMKLVLLLRVRAGEGGVGTVGEGFLGPVSSKVLYG